MKPGSSSSRASSATASAAICPSARITMLEWYRAEASYDAVMADAIVVIAHAAQATGIGQFRGKTADPFAEPESC